MWSTQLRALRAVALDPTLSSTAKSVFAALAKRYNRRTGQCNPSLQRIAEDVGRSEREVRRRALPQLVAAGAIVVLKGGRGRSNQYEIHFEQLAARDVTHDVEIGLRKPGARPDTGEARPRSGADLPGVDPGPNAPFGSGSNGPSNQTEMKTRGENPADRAASPPTSTATLQRAFAIYNEIATRVGWPQAAKLTPARASALRDRLQDCSGLPGWRAALERASRSRFLRGEAGGRGSHSGWRCDLDFLVQDKNFTRIQEGAFDDRPTPARSQGPAVLDGSPALAAIRRLRDGAAG